MLHNPFRNVIDLKYIGGIWAMLAANLYYADGTNVNPADVLSFRDIDQDADWGENVGTCLDLRKDFYTAQKALHPVNGQAPRVVVPYDLPEAKKKQLHGVISALYIPMLDRLIPEQLLLQIDGEGGTGRTTVIKTLRANLDFIADDHGIKRCPYL